MEPMRASGSIFSPNPSLLNQGPAFLEVLIRTRDIEVTRVGDEEKLELQVEIATWPQRADRYKTDAPTVFIRFFPTGSGMGMTAERYVESAD